MITEKGWVEPIANGKSNEKSKFDGEMERLRKAGDELASAIEEHAVKIRFVLRPYKSMGYACESKSENEEKAPEISALVSLVSNFADQLFLLNMRVRELTNRVEL